jgi:hypothetical protein
MLSELLRDEILSNPDWQKAKRFKVQCSDLFKKAFFTELIKSTSTRFTFSDQLIEQESRDLTKYIKFLYPDEILLEFETNLNTGYNIYKLEE